MARDKDLEQEIAEIAAITERLRVHYQGFFMGLEKVPPTVLRDQLERRIRESILNDATQAFFKFRFQASVSRYRTMSVYWDRIMRDLEMGRTTRDKLRAQKGYGTAANMGELETPKMRRIKKAAMADAGDESVDVAGGQIGAPAVAPVNDVFLDFLEARKSVGLPVEGITRAAFDRTLDKQRDIHTADPEVKDVQFSVKVKDGRVIVVARPVK
jgi:hypothetical protein